MKIINKIKIFMMMVLSIVIMGNINVYTALAEENIASGIYEVANDVYHDTEIGMSMARSYLNDTMTVKITKDEVLYTIGFSGTDYMENYRIKVNDLEVPVEIVDEDTEAGTITLQVATTSLDDQLKACIYVGPMERDVQFKVIPKFDTLTLVEKLEAPKVENKESSNENLSDETGKSEDAISEATGLANNKNMFIYIGGGIIIVALIVSLVIFKRKK